MKLVLRLLLASALMAVLPGARGADLSGTWKGAFDFQGSTVPLTINLKIDGDKVTGTVEGLPTNPAEIHDGTLTGDTVTFWVNSDYEGQTYKLVYKGKVAADQISFDFGTEDGSWSSPLTVTRRGAEPAAPATAAVPAPPAVPPAPDVPAAPAGADVTGDWKGTFDLNGTPTELKFHLKNTGNAVTGTVEVSGVPPTEVHEGKIEGDTVSFWISADYQGQAYTIVYKGKVTPGQIDFNFGTADQAWSAQVTAKKS